jgi:CBS domain-containing protein
MIEIFTNEQAWWRGKPLTDAVIERVRDLKIASRTMVTKGSQGSYETGEIAGGETIEPVSYNMPVRITIVVPEPELYRVIAAVEEMVDDGIAGVQDFGVFFHKTRGVLLPRHIRVRDIMTRAPRKVNRSTPLDEVARLLLASSFTGVPVVDEQDRPVGVIAEGDLIYKAKMEIRIGLLARSDQEKTAAVLAGLASRRASEIMTQPAVTVQQDKLVSDAVKIMVENNVKRLPVVDGAGKLVGNLSRLDIFRTVVTDCPDLNGWKARGVPIDNLHTASDIMSRSAYTVLPDTPVEDVMNIIGCNDIQRVCVLDREGHFLGLIADRDIFTAFSGIPGIWDYSPKASFSQSDGPQTELRKHLRSRTASQVMISNVLTVREDDPVDAVMRLMLERAIKRLPVLDADGKFKGLISRDSLLREVAAEPSS